MGVVLRGRDLGRVGVGGLEVNLYRELEGLYWVVLYLDFLSFVKGLGNVLERDCFVYIYLFVCFIVIIFFLWFIYS